MVVAVVAVGVVQVPVDEVVVMISVKDSRVAAVRSMPVSHVVRAASVGRGAQRQVLPADRERMLLDVIAAHPVQMAVVNVVGVTVVLD